MHLGFRFTSPPFRVLGIAAVFATAVSAWAIVTDMSDVRIAHKPAALHTRQDDLVGLVKSGQRTQAFTEAFEGGDGLFETNFNALDGVGANVGRGQRFSHVPRADLKGPGEWFNHTPVRVTGPNASACAQCHLKPFDDGAGDASANVHRDTFRTGLVSQFVQRNTPHLFAPGAVQRLAEEMTDELQARRLQLRDAACRFGGTRQIQLSAKGIDFGVLGATRTSAGGSCQVTFQTDGIRGVDFQPSVDNPAAPPDLIVRPFQWKGSVPFIRDFNRGAAHNELGMQAVEVVGDDVDGDFDGVKNELSVGDMTALAIYLAAQPRPTTLVELSALGLIDPLPSAQVASITRGFAVFQQVGCAACHVPALGLDNPIFSEPSQNAAYRDGAAFPAGQNPAARGVDPAFPITFDLTRDQPENVVTLAGGRTFRLGSLRKDSRGKAVVELFGDLKRHEMGPRLAEAVNEIAGDDVTPIPLNPRNRHTPSAFLTENLWGVGSSAPYLHDGRATTLAEAILLHGGDAQASRDAFAALSVASQKDVIAFLDNLVLFKLPPAEEETTAAPTQGTRFRFDLRRRAPN
jgi:cytochrome c551/c552